jgi:peptidoglycan/xylan/chitin deacetylase (PgdA/CDA1 family)
VKLLRLALSPAAIETSTSQGNAMPNSFWPKGKSAAISITFDDARPSQIDTALPILDKHGILGTFYVSPGGVEERLAGWRAAVARGHEIANHTYSHPCSGNFPWSRTNALEDYTPARIEADISKADKFIEDALGVTAKTFAYPCGQKFVGRGAKRQSYAPLVARRFLVGRGAFDESPNDPAFCDLASVTGISIDGVTREKLLEYVKKTVDEGAWLVTLSHGVGPSTSLSIETEVFDWLCKTAHADKKIWVDTVAAIGTYIAEKRDAGAPGAPGTL